MFNKKGIVHIIALLLINFVLFFGYAFSKGLSTDIVLKDPKPYGLSQNDVIAANLGKYEAENFDVFVISAKLPYFVSDFKIEGIDNNKIDSVVINENEPASFENLKNYISKTKKDSLIPVLKICLTAFGIELLLFLTIFCPQEGSFFENLKNNKRIFYASLFILSIFVIWNFYNISSNAVNAPYYDEWEALLPGRLDKNLNLNWIFAFHNEHKIVFTRFLTWIFYVLNGWNIKYQIIFSFFLFLSALFALYKILPAKHSLLPLFFIPLFSDTSLYNQMTEFQSQFYFMLLFCFLAINFGIAKETNLKNTLIFSAFSIAAMFSMSFTAGIALFCSFLLKEKRINKYVLIAFGIMSAGLLLYFCNFESEYIVNKITMPYEFSFWRYYISGFFLALLNIKLPYTPDIISALCIYFLVIVLACINAKIKPENYVYVALLILNFVLLGSISAGRAVNGIVHPRHYTVIMFLIPVFASLFFSFKRPLMSFAYFILLSITFAPHFSSKEYIEQRQERILGKEKLIKAIEENRDMITAEGLYWMSDEYKDITVQAKNAKRLNLSFFYD